MSTCYKFTVNNANEAATVIRERLGESARVLSVRTRDGYFEKTHEDPR